MSEAADRMRKIRQEHFGPRPDTTEPTDNHSALLNDSEASVDRAKYEMELGAHRETLERLLAEKDETILGLREHLEETRSRLAALEAAAAMERLDR